MAAPHVSGTAALVLAAVPAPAGIDADNNGAISPEERRDWLGSTADDIGALDEVPGQGLLDAEKSTTGTQTNP